MSLSEALICLYGGIFHDLDKPGGDLLSRALRQSTIGAERLNDRVRNGIEWGPLAITTRLMQVMINSKDIVCLSCLCVQRVNRCARTPCYENLRF